MNNSDYSNIRPTRLKKSTTGQNFSSKRDCGVPALESRVPIFRCGEIATIILFICFSVTHSLRLEMRF